MSEPTNTPFNILILGAGIAGLGASISLAQKGHKITILERTPALQSIGAALLIPPQVCRVIDSYGLYEKFLAADVVREEVVQLRYADGSVVGSTDLSEQKKIFGYPTLHIPRADFQRLFYERAVELGVNVRYGCRVASIDEKDTLVTLESGEVFIADVIVGADGVNSKVRSVVLGEEIKPKISDTAYICKVDGDLMRADPLTEPYMAQPAPRMWLAPGRHTVGSPIGWGKDFVMVLCFDEKDPRKPDLPANAKNWETKGDIEEIRKAFSDHEPRFRRALDLVKPEDCRLWRIAMLPNLSTWVSRSGRIAVLGDAAHAMVPYLAQGAAMATEDGATLGECLSRAKGVEQIPLALKTFESIRKPRAEKMKFASKMRGKEHHLQDGEEQAKRDEMGKALRDKQGKVTGEEDRNTNPFARIFGHDVVEFANTELDKVFAATEKYC